MSVNLFDANFYRAANSDLAGLNDAEALSHFQNNGLSEGRAFSPFTNLNFYRSSNSDLASLNNQEAFEHLQNVGVAEGRRFSQFVDINYYLSANPDISQAVAGNREAALEHLRGFGVTEGRSFSPDVDLGYYLSTNSDLNQILGENRTTALEHIQNFGLDEGRQFSPAFDVNFYRNNYPDLATLSLTTNRQLFDHWVSYGAELDKRSGTPDPGNLLGNALNLGSPTTSATSFNDFVGSTDSDDYYRFTLNEPRNLGVQLTGLTANLDLELLDINGGYLLSSERRGSAAESVTYVGLNSGTYYIRVNQGGADASSNYNLNMSVLSAQDPGNTLSDAYPLSDAIPPFNSSTTDFVGGSDTDDYYKFTLTENANFGAGIATFSPNADLYLLNSSGDTITSSTAADTNSDAIGASLTAGTYYVRISGSSSSIVYRLFVNLES